MNILVIGGSGFIGTRLVDELLVAGHKVSIYDLNISHKYPDLTIIGDVRSYEPLKEATYGIDIIYNLAAEHRDDVTPLTLYHEVNVQGTENVIFAAVANSIKHIIFTSTVAIYGLDKNCPDESFPAEPFNEYGRTKWDAEKLYQKWAKEDDRRSLGIVRPAVVFGEGNRGNVYNLIAQINSGRFIMIGNGNNRKSMGYVGNIAYFLAELIDKKGIQIFNYCDKPDLTSIEIARLISENLGKKLPRLKLPLWFGLLAGTLLDTLAKISGKKFPISAIRIRKFAAETTISTARLTQTDYSSKFTLHEGISRMIASDFE
ncbi:MAG: NAD-dependent epimerase/dehydratase family protein [Pseudohongiella nitratireducens]|nr:NAD-dependent epimerase/dehydratase family protein [Pseudohongiella nitratireducens]